MASYCVRCYSLFRNVTNNHHHIYFETFILLLGTNKIITYPYKVWEPHAGYFSVIGFDFVGNLLFCFMARNNITGHSF